MIALLACAAAPSDSAATIDPTTEGAWAVGHRAVLLDDPQRPLTVEVFYPTDAAPHSTAVPDAFLSGDQREDYAAWLAAADPDCPTATTAMVTEAEQAAGGPWPAVVLSHCHTCTRFSTFTLAARLASQVPPTGLLGDLASAASPPVSSPRPTAGSPPRWASPRRWRTRCCPVCSSPR